MADWRPLGRFTAHTAIAVCAIATCAVAAFAGPARAEDSNFTWGDLNCTISMHFTESIPPVGAAADYQTVSSSGSGTGRCANANPGITSFPDDVTYSFTGTAEAQPCTHVPSVAWRGDLHIYNAGGRDLGTQPTEIHLLQNGNGTITSETGETGSVTFTPTGANASRCSQAMSNISISGSFRTAQGGGNAGNDVGEAPTAIPGPYPPDSPAAATPAQDAIDNTVDLTPQAVDDVLDKGDTPTDVVSAKRGCTQDGGSYYLCRALLHPRTVYTNGSYSRKYYNTFDRAPSAAATLVSFHRHSGRNVDVVVGYGDIYTSSKKVHQQAYCMNRFYKFYFRASCFYQRRAPGP
jgi:hypothetical protein